jgi:hypothetical protein
MMQLTVSGKRHLAEGRSALFFDTGDIKNSQHRAAVTYSVNLSKSAKTPVEIPPVVHYRMKS